MPIKIHSNTINIADSKIWRYMSLDKFINLMESKTLYFTKLEDYRNSDPFEGYQPKVAIEKLAHILKAQHSKLIKRLGEHAENPEIKKYLSEFSTRPESTYKYFCKNTIVNCWHLNPNESEAMWKLYSENQKGVCIQSTVNRLNKSLSLSSENISIGMVKYIDFFDDNLDINSCIIDGEPITPLFKRTSYAHENELRAYITPNTDGTQIMNTIKIDINDLIDNIYISPFTNDLFDSSVRTIAKLYGINDGKVIKSKLLKGEGELLDIFKI